MLQKRTSQNGVRIISEHIPHVRSVAVGVWVYVGSKHETPEENGLTHFIEHMLFKGTATRSARQIAEEFDRIGGYVNAFTSKENTCYYAKVLDHHAKHAISVLADMFFHSQFDEQELDKERQVVLEEILMVEDTPDDDVHEQLWNVMYPNQPLGASILGTKATLETFSKDSIHQFMDHHYRPEHIVISVAGNIPDGYIDYIDSLFGHFTSNSARVDRLEPDSPIFHPGESRKTRETEQGHLCLGYPGLSVRDQHIYDLVVLNNILGGNMSSRLFQEVREEKALAYSIYSYHSSYEDSGSLAIYGGTSSNQLQKLQETIQETIQKVVDDGVTNTEVNNAKEQLKGNLMLGLESTNARMTRNGKNELTFSAHKTYDETLQEIDEVHIHHVQKLVTEIFAHKPAISIITPSKDNPL
ncbi:M16 family metallopeptidase [Paenisporosarcina indica]|uniref:M16 family metallopeptidase n=1 Tax=Paenisporosarcina indica TaxID=650093 RepID=UPI00094FD3D0|nr:pitrilysin family protein [Paenisporosarcina indica]